MISIVAIGNITKELELKTTENDNVFCKFSIASNEGSGDNQRTIYLSVIAWGNLAENLVKYAGKGKKVAVRGRIDTFEYKRKGENVRGFEVIAGEIEYLTPKTKETDPSQAEEQLNECKEHVDVQPEHTPDTEQSTGWQTLS